MELFSIGVVDLFQDRIAFIDDEIKQYEIEKNSYRKGSNKWHILTGKIYDLKQERKILVDKVQYAKEKGKEILTNG